jgi:polar amino acid transport system substrate-binding protein
MLSGGHRMKLAKLGAAAGCAILAIVDLASAQQAVSVGFPPFASPLSSLPGATPENYATLDPNFVQGAMIDLYKTIAKDAGFHVSFRAFVAGDLPGALSSGKVDILSAAVTDRNQRVMAISVPILADSEVLIANKTDTKPYRTYA